MNIVEGAQIKEVLPEPAKAINDLWLERMGSGYNDEELISRGVSGDAVLVAAVEDNTLLGFCLGENISTEKFSSKLEAVTLSDNFDNYLSYGDSTVGLLWATVIAEGAEGQGIGKQVTREARDELIRESGVVFAEAWVRDSHVDGSDLLRAIGFKKVFEEDSYWEKLTDGSYDECPECNSSPCQCPGILFCYVE